MLKPENFFNKRDPNTQTGTAHPVMDKPVSSLLVATPAIVNPPRIVPASIASSHAGQGSTGGSAAACAEVSSKLIVGPNIKLKGVEITDCDTLVVEGRVEATISSRAIQISARGVFVGSADFDIAEIRGEFDGDLTVRQKLVVHSTGRVSGKIRYGKLVIEEGGQLTGDVQLSGVGTSASAKTLMVAVDNG